MIDGAHGTRNINIFSQFSIIVDENSDQNTKKQLAILVFPSDVQLFETETHFVDVIEYNDGTAQCIYKPLKGSFEEHSIQFFWKTF